MSLTRTRSSSRAQGTVDRPLGRRVAVALAAILAVAAAPFVAVPVASAAETVVAPAPYQLAIEGTLGVGSTVTVDPRAQAWKPAAGVAFSYLWELDGEPLDGATDASLIVPDAVGSTLTVAVTGTLGDVAGTGSSATVTAPARTVKGYVKPGTATISGEAHYASALTAAPTGTWEPMGTSFSVFWFRDGAPVEGLGARYPVRQADIGHELSADVCGYNTYEFVLRTCVRTEPVTATLRSFAATSAPTIVGTAQVGATLTAEQGAWAPGDVRTRYQWFRDGAPVPGATGRTLAVTSAEVGRKLTVAVTGRLAGYTEVQRTSVATAPVGAAPLVTGSVSVSGTARVGTTLRASTPSWDSRARLTYQWYASGTPIGGATASTYAPTPSVRGKAVAVRVTGTRAGHTTTSRTSAAKAVGSGVFSAQSPMISGTPKVGATVTAHLGTWAPAASTYAYQWSVNGRAVSRATKASYTVRTQDRGAKLTVTVRGTRTGYTTAATTSAASVVGSSFSTAATPTITGTARVGSTLTARAGTWSPRPTARSYQWFAGGRPVPGATGTTYQPTRSDHGRTITVTARTYRPGYATTIRTSAPTAAIAWPVGMVSPTITAQPWQMGVEQPGARPTSFQVTAAGGDLTYRWQRSANGGATWTDVPGGDWIQVDVPTTASARGSLYRVVVANLVGSVTSTPVRFEVESTLGSPVDPGRLLELDSWTVTIGRTTTTAMPVDGDDAHPFVRASVVACYVGTAARADPANDLQFTYFDSAGQITYGIGTDADDDAWRVGRGGWDHVAPGECVTFGAYEGRAGDDQRGTWRVADVSQGWSAGFVRGLS